MSSKVGAMSLALVLLCGPLGPAGCAFYPKVDEHHVDSCESETYPITMDLATDGINCGSGDLGACMVALVVIGSVTLVVSGTVVLVGNTAYAIDKLYRCKGKADGPAGEKQAPEAPADIYPDSWSMLSTEQPGMGKS